MLRYVDKVMKDQPNVQTPEIILRGINKQLYFNPGVQECQRQKCSNVTMDKGGVRECQDKKCGQRDSSNKKWNLGYKLGLLITLLILSGLIYLVMFSGLKTPVTLPPQQDDALEVTHDDMPPFSEIMDGVMFTVSGFPATMRDKIRKKAVAMGATYSHKWDDSCTHLICDSTGAAKYNLAKRAGAIIVRREWVEASHANKRMQPWGKFSLDS